MRRMSPRGSTKQREALYSDSRVRTNCCGSAEDAGMFSRREGGPTVLPQQGRLFAGQTGGFTRRAQSLANVEYQLRVLKRERCSRPRVTCLAEASANVVLQRTDHS